MSLIMKHFEIIDQPLGDLKLIQRSHIEDSRGFFSRIFCAEELLEAGWNEGIAQVNQTYTIKTGTVRGLHFQWPPYAEAKLVTCTKGAVWDVVVDLRAGSATFLNWHAVHLSEKNCASLVIPKGFAHGFQTLIDNTQMIYCHSTIYDSKYEGAINAMDPKINIHWPIPIINVSERDLGHQMLDEKFKGLSL